MFGRDDSSVSQNIQSITRVDGSQIVYSYQGDLVSEVSSDAGSLKFTYTDDHVTKVTDSTGRSVILSYDGTYLTAAVNPDADSLLYSYSNGLLETIENFENQVYLTNQYDSKGRVTEQYVAEQGTFRFAYDEDRRQNTCTGENGYYLSIVYDEDGRIIESIDNNSTKHIA